MSLLSYPLYESYRRSGMVSMRLTRVATDWIRWAGLSDSARLLSPLAAIFFSLSGELTGVTFVSIGSEDVIDEAAGVSSELSLSELPPWSPAEFTRALTSFSVLKFILASLFCRLILAGAEVGEDRLDFLLSLSMNSCWSSDTVRRDGPVPAEGGPVGGRGPWRPPGETGGKAGRAGPPTKGIFGDVTFTSLFGLSSSMTRISVRLEELALGRIGPGPGLDGVVETCCV